MAFSWSYITAMVQHRPSTQTKVTVVPKDGAIEITLNINITVDGKITATSDDAEVVSVQKKEESEKTTHVIPDFLSGLKLKFGKEE
jgi:hypothetical protein